jgi:hypothetical protein
VRNARGLGIGRHLAVRAVAGVIGTAAMDLLLYRRNRHEDGKASPWRWEFAGVVFAALTREKP